MKIVVWVVSGLLALFFLAVGTMKVIAPADQLATMAAGVPVLLLKVAGAAEILGALGLILPAATRIMPVLTPIAAAGLVLLLVGAIITNIVTGAYAAIPGAVVALLLAGFVAWARFGKWAVQPRGAKEAAAA